MSILQILILAVVAILVNQLKQGRSLVLLGISALVIYWIQPIQDPVNLTFWFPTFTLALTVIFWLLTSTPETRGRQQNWGAMAVMSGVIILVDLNRYFKFDYLFVVDTPRVQMVITLLIGLAAVSFLLAQFKKFPAIVFVLAAIGLIVTLVVLKMPFGLARLIEIVSGLRGKDAGNASALSWLGFSYVAFRLLYTTIDRQAGRFPSVSLWEYV